MRPLLPVKIEVDMGPQKLALPRVRVGRMQLPAVKKIRRTYATRKDVDVEDGEVSPRRSVPGIVLHGG